LLTASRVITDTTVSSGASSIVTSALTAPGSIFRMIPGRVLRALSFMGRSSWRVQILACLPADLQTVTGWDESHFCGLPYDCSVGPKLLRLGHIIQLIHPAFIF